MSRTDPSNPSLHSLGTSRPSDCHSWHTEDSALSWVTYLAWNTKTYVKSRPTRGIGHVHAGGFRRAELLTARTLAIELVSRWRTPEGQAAGTRARPVGTHAHRHE